MIAKHLGFAGLCLSAGIGLGLTCLGIGESGALQDLKLEEKLSRMVFGSNAKVKPIPRASLMDPTSLDTSAEDPVLVVDGVHSNSSITAPGAMVALALMYLQTNDTQAASLFKLPDSHFALDEIRSEHLLVMVLCRELILWDRIAPTRTWMDGCLAPVRSRRLGNLAGPF